MHGHLVIVYPGLGGGAFTTSHLRRFLAESRMRAPGHHAGHAFRCAGRGNHAGTVYKLLIVLRIVANRLAQPEGRQRALRRGERLGRPRLARS
jgi:hypothetical protein